MVDTASWIRLELDVVDDLHLDPRNVRLETPEGVPESDIIQDLFSNEKAFGLVEAITQIGWLRHELPIVVVRDGNHVVVEGNRRVAALKAIQNPLLAPEFQARITRLVQASTVTLESIKSIPVTVATNQDEADQVIAALHTGAQRVAWGPARQAAFFQAQIDNGKTVDQLREQYPLIDVMKFVTRSSILDLFRTVDYRDPALRDYVRHRRKFKVSTLARLYDYDRFLELAGIEIDEHEGSAELKLPALVFRDLAEKIVTDIRQRKIDTRVLNSTKSQSYIEYMAELRATLDKAYEEEAAREKKISDAEKSASGASRSRSSGNGGTNQGSSTDESAKATDTSNGTSKSNNRPASTRAKPEPKKPKLRYLSMENIVPDPGRPRSIHAIRDELGALDIERFPNATLDVMRSFLEKSIKSYADAQGIEIRQQVNVQGFVYLSHSLLWLEQYLASDPKNRALIQVVQKIRSNKLSSYAANSDHLNAINHNHKISATESDVRDAWETVAGLIEVLVK